MKQYLAGAARCRCCPGGRASRRGGGQEYIFALVPKNTNNPFFDQARDGCKKAEKELKGAIEVPVYRPRRARRRRGGGAGGEPT